MGVLRRYGVDVALVGAAIACGVVLLQAGEPAPAPAAAAGLLAFLGRRHAPFVSSLAAVVLMTVAFALVGESPTVLFFATMLVFALAGALNPVGRAVVVWASGALLMLGAFRVANPPGWISDYVLTLGFVTVLWAAGVLVARHTRRAQLMALRAREATEAGDAALREQRAQIARELHDVVSHGLAVVVLQTAAARGALEDGDTSGLAKYLDTVEGTAREALDEMRRMLGVIRGPELVDGAVDPPSPGLDSLASLVDRSRDAGLVIDDCVVEVEREVPAGVALTAYRIVQEALTNVAKHASGAHVTIEVRVVGTSLRVEVRDAGGRSDPLAATGQGFGLQGLEERVSLYAGRIRYGPTGPDGAGFAVRAELPLALGNEAVVR